MSHFDSLLLQITLKEKIGYRKTLIEKRPTNNTREYYEIIPSTKDVIRKNN